MPGKTMIGGTAYDVKPGNVMVGGTVYTIKEGKVMVDGTAYSIKFAGDVVVTITGTGYSSGTGGVITAYVTINGTQYTSEATVPVQAGTEIQCYAKILAFTGNGGVYLNGSQLGVETYAFNAESDVSINLYDAFSNYGEAKITTT